MTARRRRLENLCGVHAMSDQREQWINVASCAFVMKLREGYTTQDVHTFARDAMAFADRQREERVEWLEEVLLAARWVYNYRDGGDLSQAEFYWKKFGTLLYNEPTQHGPLRTPKE